MGVPLGWLCTQNERAGVTSLEGWMVGEQLKSNGVELWKMRDMGEVMSGHRFSLRMVDGL